MRKNILKKVKIWRVPDITAAVTGFLCSAISVPAMADSGAIINGISNGTQQIWNILVGIVAPIAAVALAICAIKICTACAVYRKRCKRLVYHINLVIWLNRKTNTPLRRGVYPFLWKELIT